MSTTPSFVTGQSPSRFKMVYLLRDDPSAREMGAVEELIKTAFPDVRFMDLWLPPFGASKKQMELWVSKLSPFLMPNTLLVGIGHAGTAVCWLQERFSDLSFGLLNLSVFAINAPTEDSDFTVERRHANRVALFSKDYPPIKDHTENWPWMAETSLDVCWLQHGILSENGNLCKYAVALLISAYIQNPDIQPVYEAVAPI